MLCLRWCSVQWLIKSSVLYCFQFRLTELDTYINTYIIHKYINCTAISLKKQVVRIWYNFIIRIVYCNNVTLVLASCWQICLVVGRGGWRFIVTIDYFNRVLLQGELHTVHSLDYNICILLKREEMILQNVFMQLKNQNLYAVETVSNVTKSNLYSATLIDLILPTVK